MDIDESSNRQTIRVNTAQQSAYHTTMDSIIRFAHKHRSSPLPTRNSDPRLLELCTQTPITSWRDNLLWWITGRRRTGLIAMLLGSS